jgi:hypothetical protein
VSRIHHHNEIAGIDMRGEFGFVLAPKTVSDFGGQSAKHLVGGINNKPVALDFVRLGGKSLHVSALAGFVRDFYPRLGVYYPKPATGGCVSVRAQLSDRAQQT